MSLPSPPRVRSSDSGSIITLLALMAPALVCLGWFVSRVSTVWSERPEMQFGWIVLMLSGYLLYEKWDDRPEIDSRLGWFQFASLSLALALLFPIQISLPVLGLNSTALWVHAFAALLVTAGCLHAAFGWPGVRQFGFAFAFLLVALPIPSAVYGPVVASLQKFVAGFNVELLSLLGIPAQRVGSLIHLPTGTVGVDEACSGIRSLQSSIMATLFIGYLSLRSNLLRVLLFIGGSAIAVAGNVVRSFYLSYTASSRGVESVNQVHDSAGWSILLFTAVGVAFSAWLLSRVEKAAVRAASLSGSTDTEVTEGPRGS